MISRRLQKDLLEGLEAITWQEGCVAGAKNVLDTSYVYQHISTTVFAVFHIFVCYVDSDVIVYFFEL